MADTLLLDRSTWDLTLNAAGDMAVASNPYSLAQDAASVIKTFAGEVYWDTTLGLPWLTSILGKNPSISQLRAYFIAAAMTVPDVASAKCYLTAVSGRRVSGQVQVTSASTGQTSAADFEVVNPQGG